MKWLRRLNGVDWQKGLLHGPGSPPAQISRPDPQKRLFSCRRRGRPLPSGTAIEKMARRLASCARAQDGALALLQTEARGGAPLSRRMACPIIPRIPASGCAFVRPAGPGLADRRRQPESHPANCRLGDGAFETDQPQSVHHAAGDRRHLRRRYLDPLDRPGGRHGSSSNGAAMPSMRRSPRLSPCRWPSRICAAPAATCR